MSILRTISATGFLSLASVVVLACSDSASKSAPAADAGTPAADGGADTSVPSTCPAVTGAGTKHDATPTADETWTAAASPHVIGAKLSIPAGRTITVEPCAIVQIKSASGMIVEGKLDPSGKMQDASNAIAQDPTAQAVLGRAVAAMEQARSHAVRSSPEHALALWQGLVAGEWSLVEHWESGGRRYLAAYRNRPEVRDPRALTPTECATLKYLALGATNKEIAFALGLPAGTVSSSVTKVMKKLRVKRRVDLAVLGDPSRMDRLDVAVADREVGILAVNARPRGAAAAALSIVELEVTSYVTRGWSNERIALEREVSPRTIANQLRAVYEKLGIRSRSQLARAMTK